MWYDGLFTNLEKLYDKEQANSMSAYMQNKFKFLGIPKPKLSEFIKPYVKESKKYDLDWEFVNLCWNNDYREFQYVALEYLKANAKKMYSSDINQIKTLIINKSWWETVDTLDYFVGELILNDKSLENTMIEWSLSNNLWLRRVSIDFQQKYKEKTNQELLEKIILNNLESNEFFINKSIGWSLREYSKTNSKWVKEFINKYKDRMDKLSIKEANKYL